MPHENFVIREQMVPMRDRVELCTLVISPKENTDALPIILRRTPYDPTGVLRRHVSSRLDVSVGYEFLGNDTIYVVNARFSIWSPDLWSQLRRRYMAPGTR